MYMISLETQEPEIWEHIVVTDGHYYRSGFFIETKEGVAFLPDCDDPFDIAYWMPTDFNEE